MSSTINDAMTIKLDYELPEYPAFEAGIRRAPRRESHLTEADKALAIKNALRYIHPDHHEQMAKEFAQELEEHGRIYGYRFRPAFLWNLQQRMLFMHDFPTPDVWLAHRVSYGETDTMGYLYYAEYLHLFERSRSEYIREMGMSYAEVERLGIMLPVREAQCRYRRPARYDDLIHIRAGIAEVRRASLVFVYNVMDAERKTLLAEGMTEHACTGRDGRPVRPPEWFVKLMRGEPVQIPE